MTPNHGRIMITAPIAELAQTLRSGRLSSVELTQGLLDRIDAHGAALNAFLTLDREGAWRGAVPPTCSAPVGTPARWSYPGRAQGRADDGRTAHDLRLAHGQHSSLPTTPSSSSASPRPAWCWSARPTWTNSRWVRRTKTRISARSATPGTGRACRAEARRLGRGGGGAPRAAATGTDTGGSIRQPAALSGVCGLKPTYGVCSRYGLVAFASSLDTPGVLTQTAQDCALLLNAMAGHDARDSTCLDRPAEDYSRDLSRPLQGLRIGLPREYFAGGTEAGVLAAIDAALVELRRLGATTVDIGLPNVELAVPVYYVLAPAEASSNLSRFDGVRYGHRAEHYTDLLDMYQKTRAEGFGAEVKRRILVGTYVLSHGYYDAYYLKAQQVRRLIADISGAPTSIAT